MNVIITNSYLFYLMLLAIVVISGSVRELSNGVVKWIYFLFSVPLVLFTALRPFWLMRDDEGYLARFNNTYFDEAISIDALLGRDPLYGIVIGFGKLLWNDPRVMLLVGALGLAVKLTLLFKISTKDRLLVLLVYASVYWPLHDLTQFRVSLSLVFFWLTIYLIINRGKLLQFLGFFLTFSGHSQALPSVLLWLRVNKIKVYQFQVVSIALLGLMLLGLYPDLTTLAEYLLLNEGPQHLRDSYGMYHMRAEAGNYLAFRDVPIMLIVYVIVFSYLAWQCKAIYDQKKVQFAFRSILLGMFLSFIFASVSDVQVRFYEFFMLPGLLLVGEMVTWQGKTAAGALAIAYYFKFNVLWSIWQPWEWWIIRRS